MQEKLPQRKQIRLKEYDYSEEGYYFITICTKNRMKILGEIKYKDEYYQPTIQLTKEGIIIDKYLKRMHLNYENVILDEYTIMPNHIHMIIRLNKKENLTISRIIKQYKMIVSKEIRKSIWQKSFYEHIIRNEKEYYLIKKYIMDNVGNWYYDKYYN